MKTISDGVQGYLKDRYGDDLSSSDRKNMGNAVEGETRFGEKFKLATANEEKQKKIILKIVNRLKEKAKKDSKRQELFDKLNDAEKKREDNSSSPSEPRKAEGE